MNPEAILVPVQPADATVFSTCLADFLLRAAVASDLTEYVTAARPLEEIRSTGQAGLLQDGVDACTRQATGR